MKRVFLIVLDSLGIGEMPDAAEFGDVGSNTLGAIRQSSHFSCQNLANLGLFNIDGVVDLGGKVKSPTASFARMTEKSMGKDTTVGHLEISGLVSENPMPTYPSGFPSDIIKEFSSLSGRGVLCNKPYSGTDVIRDYGEEHIKSGDLIVYTSQDSVFQIAAHEDVVSINELYDYCKIARKLLCGKHAVGRVIARPFAGNHPFVRTKNRHDFSLEPQGITMLDVISNSGMKVFSVGKIFDIFAGRGLTDKIPSSNNSEGIKATEKLLEQKFEGLCFVNLVDFDMVYGHRNNVDGYAAAMSSFDVSLPNLMHKMKKDDIMIITADHGCDPSTPSTDHSREYTPMLIFGDRIKQGINLGTRKTFGDIGATVLEYLGLSNDEIYGQSFLSDVLLER